MTTDTMNSTEREVIFSNQNYRVDVILDTCGVSGDYIETDGTNYFDCYEVVNHTTGVVEHRTNVLPKALSIAEQFSIALENEYHTFLRKAKDEEPAANSVPPAEVLGNLMREH